jgi:hypothetical protein
LKVILQNNFQNRFEGWTRRWHRCIASQREYIEGDHSDSTFTAMSSRTLLSVPVHFTGHQISLDGAGLRGLHVDYMNSSSDYFMYFLQVTPSLIRKECRLRIDLNFDNRLWKLSAKMNPASWIARLQSVDYPCFIGCKLQQLCCPSYIRLWHSSLLR